MNKPNFGPITTGTLAAGLTSVILATHQYVAFLAMGFAFLMLTAIDLWPSKRKEDRR